MDKLLNSIKKISERDDLSFSMYRSVHGQKILINPNEIFVDCRV
jgi:hypothetical protein